MFKQTTNTNPNIPVTTLVSRVLRFVLFFVALTGVFLYTRTGTPAPVSAATSSNLNFQARLLTGSGSIVPDGSYNVQFNLYNVTTGGTSLWSETYFDSNGVTAGNDNRVNVRAGYLSVSLGSQTAFPALNWDQDLYLTMNIGGTTQTATPTWDGEMTPRLKLTAVPYAMSAGSIAKYNGVQTGTLAFSTVANSPNILLPDASGTVCLQTSSACGFATGTNASYIQNGTTTQTANFNVQSAAAANIGAIIQGHASQSVDIFRAVTSGGSGLKVSSTGEVNADNGLTVTGSASASVSLLTPLLDTASAVALNVGTTNATVINLNQNTILAAGKSLVVTGSTSFPGSPTEGQIYYRTDTDQLYIYTGAKWQADRSTATKIVAAAGAQNGERADYQVTSAEEAAGNADVAIQAAISVLPASGGVVYLTEGTYTIDTSISIPSNVTLAGSGAATIIKLKNAINVDFSAIVNSDATNGNFRITLRDFRLDGNKANNTAGNQHGVNFTKVGSGTGATAVPGSKITGLFVDNFRNVGLLLNTNANSTISGNSVQNGQIGSGIFAPASLNNVFSGNILQKNYGAGIWLDASPAGNTITGNISDGNDFYGINVDSGTGNTISGNTVKNNSSIGIVLQNGTNFNSVTGNTISGNADSGIWMSGNNNTIATNKLHNNGGAGNIANIYISSADGNTVTGNDITDTAGTGFAINIFNALSDNNYLSDNRYSGTGATSINDAGTGTIYAGQLTGSNDFVLQGMTDVGIGTLTPDAKLEILQSSTSTTADTLQGVELTVTDTGIVTTGTDTTFGQKLTVTRTGATGGTINTTGLDLTVIGDAGGTSTAIGLNVNVSGADANYAAIFQGGNVGIGTAAPATKLQVNDGAFQMIGNLTSTGASLIYIGTTFNSSNASQYGIQNQSNFNPSVAVSQLYGLVNLPTLATSSQNVTEAIGAFSRIDTAASYTGQITSGYGFKAGNPSIAGTNRITNYSGVQVDGISGNGGNTTGTLTNYGIKVDSTTAASGIGGTVNNYGLQVATPNGSGTNGSTNNYGLRITGNSSAGDTNYSLYNDSTSQSYFAGSVGIGTNTGTSSALHTVATGARTANYTGNLLTNTATSSTASINKYGLEIQSTGVWNGASANNVGLYISSVTGGTNNYDAIFNGGGNVGIGTAAPGAKLDVNGSVIIQGANSLTLGTVANQGSIAFRDGSSAFTGTVRTGTLTGNVTYQLPVVTAGTYNICTDSGNCNGVGATLQTGYTNSIGGTTPEIKLDATRTGVDIQDADTTLGATTNLLTVRGSNNTNLGSILFGVQANGNVTASGAIQGLTASLTGANSLSLGTASTNTGKITLFNSANNNALVLQSGTTGAGGLTLTLPTADGANLDCLKTNGTGGLSFGGCLNGGGSGGGVTFLNSFAGSITITGTSNQVTVANGSNNISLSLPQDIGTVSSPRFAGLTTGSAPSTLTTITDNPLSNSATTINVSSTTGYPAGSTASPATLLIESEIVTYTGTTATSFTGVVRGAYGSTAAAHSSGVTVNNFLLNVATGTTATPKFAVTGNGNVGIGTANPGKILEIAPAGNVTTLLGLVSSGGSGSEIQFGTNGTYNTTNGASIGFGRNVASALEFFTNGVANSNTAKLIILNSGNVGIGTTGPTSILHTVATGTKTASYTGNLLTNVATSSTASINKYGLEIQSTGVWNGASANNVGLYVSSVTGGTNNYDAIFNGGGNVGIGTASPQALLEVSSATNANLFLTKTGTNAGSAQIFNDGGFNIVSNSATDIIYSRAATHVYLNRAATTEYMRISSAGNVGIGTTGPGAKLDISNAAAANTTTGFRLQSTFAPTAGGTQTNASLIVTNAPTVAANTAVGLSLAVNDATAFTNTLQGINLTLSDTGTTAKAVRGLFVDTSGTTNASASVTAALFKGTTTTNLVIQNGGATELLRADTTNMVLKIGTTAAPTFGATTRLFTTVAEVSTSIRVGDGTNGIDFTAGMPPSTTNGFYKGTSRPTKRASLVPEYAGGVMSPDGLNNSGTMTSDFCSNTSPALNTGVCTGAGEKHNYYSWTSAAGTNDYDIYVRYQLPSDWDGLASDSTINMWGWHTGASDSVTLSMYNAGGGQCGTTTTINSATNAGWGTETALAGVNADADCTTANMAAGSTVTFVVHLTATSGNFARAGEIRFDYLSKF